MIISANIIGGGSIAAPTDAVLHVTAPAGSTVTISKGSVTKSDLGHVNISDTTLYDYYFVIHQSQFDSVNPWVVTSTLGSDTKSDTVIIDSADEYDVILKYWNGELYDSGNEYTSVTGGWDIVDNRSATLVKNDSNMVFSSSSRDLSSFLGMSSSFDPTILASFNTLNITISANTGTGTASASRICVYNQQAGTGTQLAYYTMGRSATGTFSCDISGVSTGYPKFANFYSVITITKIWLS